MGLGAEISWLLSQPLPAPTCTAEIRLCRSNFSKDCLVSPGTLPDVISRHAKLRLSGFPCFPWMVAHSCSSAAHQCRAGIPGPSHQDLGRGILVLCLLWPLEQWEPPRAATIPAGKSWWHRKAGNGFRKQNRWIWARVVFSQLSQELYTGSLAFCYDSKGREMLDHPGISILAGMWDIPGCSRGWCQVGFPWLESAHSVSCRSQWLQGSGVLAAPSQIQGLTPGFRIFVCWECRGLSVSHVPLGAVGDVATPAAPPATFQQISGSVLSEPIKAGASSAPFPAPRWFPGYFCGIGRAQYQQPAWSSASPAGGRKGKGMSLGPRAAQHLELCF